MREAIWRGKPLSIYEREVRGFQGYLVRTFLDEAGGNVSETARRLQVTRPYLHKLMRKLGVQWDRENGATQTGFAAALRR
jgi:DNA-binding NtrC family response regulator